MGEMTKCRCRRPHRQLFACLIFTALLQIHAYAGTAELVVSKNQAGMTVEKSTAANALFDTNALYPGAEETGKLYLKNRTGEKLYYRLGHPRELGESQTLFDALRLCVTDDSGKKLYDGLLAKADSEVRVLPAGAAEKLTCRLYLPEKTGNEAAGQTAAFVLTCRMSDNRTELEEDDWEKPSGGSGGTEEGAGGSGGHGGGSDTGAGGESGSESGGDGSGDGTGNDGSGDSSGESGNDGGEKPGSGSGETGGGHGSGAGSGAGGSGSSGAGGTSKPGKPGVGGSGSHGSSASGSSGGHGSDSSHGGGSHSGDTGMAGTGSGHIAGFGYNSTGKAQASGSQGALAGPGTGRTVIYDTPDLSLQTGISGGVWVLEDALKHLWKYRLEDGTELSGGWAFLENPYAKEGQPQFGWYHFDQQGYMSVGWIHAQGDAWYHTNPVSDGSMGLITTGWMTDIEDGRRYYLDPSSGIMQTGWLNLPDENGIQQSYYFARLEDTYGQNWFYQTALGRWVYDRLGRRTYGSLYQNEETPDGSHVDERGVKMK